MSLCGVADGHLLVHGGSSPGCHRDAPRLPFPHFGSSSIQESVHSVLSGDQFPLPQWSFDGVVHRGVGPASQDRPEGPQCCWTAAGQVSGRADYVASVVLQMVSGWGRGPLFSPAQPSLATN